MIIELNIFQVISGLAVSILLDVYLSTLVLYLEEEGPSTIIRWDLTSGCHMHKVEGNHFHFSLSLCVCVFVCMCVHICELMRVCSPQFAGEQCTEVDKNWEYQVYKGHRPQQSSL